MIDAKYGAKCCVYIHLNEPSQKFWEVGIVLIVKVTATSPRVLRL